VASGYQTALSKIDQDWRDQVKTYVLGIDDQARKILSGLARDAQSLPRMAFPESLALIAQRVTLPRRIDQIRRREHTTGRGRRHGS
jgi:hypothetical protein